MSALLFRRSIVVGALLTACVLGSASSVAAQNREHLQIFADLRMLQEQVARLQKAAAEIDETMKAVTKRLDDQSAATVKQFADQRLVINNLGTSVTTLREKLDDNAVAVRQLTPEVSAIREGVGMLTTLLNQMLGLLQPPTSPVSGLPGDPGAPAAGASAVPTAVALPPSPKALYDQAMGNFVSGRIALAIEGFQEVIDRFPNATDYAASAQFGIGDSLFFQLKFKEALAAYQLVVTKYKGSTRVPDAMYQQGQCYQRLGQKDEAVKIYTTLLKTFPESTAALQATQALKGMGAIK